MTLLQSYLEFIKELELLKNITRTAWTSAGKKEKHCRASASGFIYLESSRKNFRNWMGKSF